jgi:hypothetical protein
MRRFMATLGAISLALIASAGPAAADVQKLVIKDPGWVQSNVCQAGTSCGDGFSNTQAIIELVIKCPEGEVYTLVVLVKQGDENQGTTQTGGECSGDGRHTFVGVEPDTGSFSPGSAKVKASAFSDPGGGPSSSAGVFDVNTDRKITLIEGSPEI